MSRRISLLIFLPKQQVHCLGSVFVFLLFFCLLCSFCVCVRRSACSQLASTWFCPSSDSVVCHYNRALQSITEDGSPVLFTLLYIDPSIRFPNSVSLFFPFSFSFYLRFCTQFLASWSEIPSLRAAVLDSMCAAVRRGEERSDRSSRSPFWMSNIRTGFRAIRSTKEPLLDRGNCTTGHLCRAQNSRCAKWIPSFECRLIMSAPLPHSPL